MINTRFVRPVEGRRVRNPASPENEALPSAGLTVTWSPYWQRKLDAGDIEFPPAKGKTTPSES